MVIKSQQIFNKVYLDRDRPSDFIEFIAHSLKRELINKFMDELEDHKLRLVVLEEPEFIDDPPGPWHDQCAYTQNLEFLTLVRCEDCRMSYPWCQRFRDELGGNGFCPYGKEIENA